MPVDLPTAGAMYTGKGLWFEYLPGTPCTCSYEDAARIYQTGFPQITHFGQYRYGGGGGGDFKLPVDYYVKVKYI